MAKWTAEDMPDQSGRTAIVTGANSGLGWHVSLELARRGARVILACRDQTRGQAALDRLLGEVPGASAELRALDLASLDSVRVFAEGVDEPIDLLVNNAGVMAGPHRTTADGFELQFGTNHLGHFALTGLLLPRLLETSRPRVVAVSSGAHRMGKMDFDDLQSEGRYWRWGAYGQSKLSNLLFMAELARRAADAGLPLVSVAAHPGYAATNLQTTGHRVDDLLMKVPNLVVAQSDAMGALPLLYAATEDLEGGAYIGPDGIGEQRGHPTLVGRSGRAKDEEAARRLWQESERLTGVTYDAIAPAAGREKGSAMRKSMPVLLSAAALAGGAAVPATAAADKTFEGKTAQNRMVKVTTGDDNVLKSFRVNWLTRKCAQSGSRFQHITPFRPPFDLATPDEFRDAGSFTVADRGRIRSRVTITLTGRHAFDAANPAAENWFGTLKAKVVVRRRGKVIDRCNLRQINWSAGLPQ